MSLWCLSTDDGRLVVRRIETIRDPAGLLNDPTRKSSHYTTTRDEQWSYFPPSLPGALGRKV